MVKSHGSYYRDHRILYYVRGIESSAKAYFEHCHIDLLLCKIEEADRRDEFELSRLIAQAFRDHLFACLLNL